MRYSDAGGIEHRVGPRSGRMGRRDPCYLGADWPIGVDVAIWSTCLARCYLPKRGLEERIPFHSSNFLLFPLGAGSSGVCEYVTVRVTTWRTETLLVLLDSGSVGE